MNPIERLTEYFLNFPGIGPRQAKRFAYHLLLRDQATLDDISSIIKDLKRSIKSCTMCHRFFNTHNPATTLCNICSGERNNEQLLIVPRDGDVDVIERSKAYSGLYFVLGGTVPILDKEPTKRIRINSLLARVEKDKNNLKEIILAANLNPEGEHTMEYVEHELKPIIKDTSINITHLGRGFSTGTEIEYSDSETIKYALKNRF